MSEDLRQTLTAQFGTDLGRAIEAMTGESPKIRFGPPAARPSPGWAIWRQKFSALPGSAWLAAISETWVSLGSRTLRAAGIDEDDPATAKSTFVEVLGQAFSMLARSVSGRTRSPWASTEGCEVADPPESMAWTAIDISFSDGQAEQLLAAFDDVLLSGLGHTETALVSGEREVAPAPAAPVEKSKTLDLLLDVELPVSVSFGRAQLSLKDVIKLTTGSIVELNRTISEPVEVIVNNCVIARGEVVVVEGNFGVRIQQVVSREERLRTLY